MKAGSWRSSIGGRDVAIGVLSVAVLVLAGALFGTRERAESRPDAVKIVDVVLEPEESRFVDFVFDRPVVGTGVEPGEVLATAPATIEPTLVGVWQWQGGSVLRFSPASGLPPASRVRFEWIEERLLEDGRSLGGERAHVIETDPFLLEGIDWEERPKGPSSHLRGGAQSGLEGGPWVVMAGALRFNYAVDPALLAPRVRLIDSRGEEMPQVELEIGYSSEVVPFRVGPILKTAEERTLTLVVDGDLTSLVGNAPLGEEASDEFRLGSSTALKVRGVETRSRLGESEILVELSSSVTAEDAEASVSLEPDVPFKLSSSHNVLTLRGELELGRRYVVRVSEGLEANDGATLGDDFVQELALANLEPSLDFRSRGMFLSRSGNRRLAIESTNVQKIEIAVDRVYRNNLFFLLQQGNDLGDGETYSGAGLWHPLGDRLASRTVRLRTEINTPRITSFDLDELADLDQRGIYRVLLSRSGQWRAPQRWLLVTDLGAIVKLGREQISVWTLSHESARPASGVRVELVSDQNQVLASGASDGGGFWRGKLPDDARPYYLTLERGDDFSFVLLNAMRVDTTGLDVSGARTATVGYSAYIYGERDLYRPGESINGIALLRDAQLRAAPSMPVRLLLRDPQGRELERKAVRSADDGSVLFDWQLPDYALTGRYAVEAYVADERVGSYAVQIEEFVPDRIEVEISAAESIDPGDDLVVGVESRYLFGPPADGLPVEVRARLEHAEFRPEGFEAFAFGNAYAAFEPRDVALRSGALDEEGRGSFEIEMPSFDTPPERLRALLTARVQEQGGRGVVARETVWVDRVPHYLGLRRLGEGYPEPDDEVTFEWAAVTPHGDASAVRSLEVELNYERWHTVLRRTPSGNFRYESSREIVPVERTQVDVGSGGEGGRFTLTPRDFGSHVVVIRDPQSGAATTLPFYVSGWGTAPWAIESPDRVQIELDREEVGPGESVRALVRAPFSGRLLVTLEREDVAYHASYDMTGNTATVDVPVPAGLRPNAYITATVVRGTQVLESGSVGRAFGAVPISIDRLANRLPLDVTSPDELRSRSTVSIDIETEPRATVTVAAVDEGILQLIAQRTPDPFSFFYRKRALSTSTYESFALLLPELLGIAPAGGGEDATGRSQFVRTEGIRRQKPVSFWSSRLQADAQGKVRAQFELPEFQGALRVMAVASKDRRFSSFESRVTVRDPIVLLPTFPRVLSHDEELLIPVVVRSDLEEQTQVVLQIEATGNGEVTSDSSVTLDLMPGTQALHAFDLRSGPLSEPVTLSLRATGRGVTVRTSATLDVRPDLPAVRDVERGRMEASETSIPAVSPVSYRPGSARRSLQIGKSPSIRLAADLDELLRYPYGCLEQVVSQAFPVIYVEDLAREMLAAQEADSEQTNLTVDSVVREAVRKASFQQVYGGGFSLWPGGRVARPWLSVYVTHFLVEAQRAGFPVDPQLLDAALDYVGNLARSGQRRARSEAVEVTYALYVLARGGEADLGTMDALRDRGLQNLSSASRGLLSAAYAAVGHSDAATELATLLEDVEERERQSGRGWASTARDRALLLMALLEVEESSPRVVELVDRLSRDSAARARVWSTHDRALSLLALGRFARHVAEAPNVEGRVVVGDEVVGTFDSATPATFTDLPTHLPLRVELEGVAEVPPPVYWSLETRGVPSDAAYESVAAGIEVERAILARDGSSADLMGVRQGDLLVLRTQIRSTAGSAHDVVVSQLLPGGLEVENPRLATTEQLPWMRTQPSATQHVDLRDDAIHVFLDLDRPNEWSTIYSLVRAVAPGAFRLPPVVAEAMYDGSRRASGPRDQITVISP